jgi:hypothetical protein
MQVGVLRFAPQLVFLTREGEFALSHPTTGDDHLVEDVIAYRKSCPGQLGQGLGSGSS